MFDVGLQEMLVIGVLALLVFGPSKLPELGRMFGRAMREFRRASDEFRSTVETNLNINDLGPVIESESTATDRAATVAADTPTASAVQADTPTAETSPAVAGAEAVVVAENDEAHPEPFCGQRDSRLFHRSTCDWARRIPAGDRVYFKQFSDARDAGLLGCPVCDPRDIT